MRILYGLVVMIYLAIHWRKLLSLLWFNLMRLRKFTMKIEKTASADESILSNVNGAMIRQNKQYSLQLTSYEKKLYRMGDPVSTLNHNTYIVRFRM